MKILKPKYYLNKNLKPRFKSDELSYPVYFRFTIGKNNHRIKSVLIGRLENDDDLKNYKREIELETAILNHLYIKVHDYPFSRFNYDAWKLSRPLSEFIGEIMSRHIDEFESEAPQVVYMKELKTYIISKTDLPFYFIDSAIDHIDFSSTLPVNFIKDAKLKFIVDTYNFCYLFNERINPSVFCMYNWRNTSMKEEFSALYGSSHSNFVEKAIKLVDDISYTKTEYPWEKDRNDN